ncbi:hypothetical protein AKJ09_10241 [Labilithrix luteola]|uniref:PID domain-containing protein n=1 Tax=Labilithrix luteola TaxID=1391654 RepID=A0A0K1QCX1_9BACT|nr:MarR family transcriptional regulator [Labilithrix luteola]AKV03578.1 hypothetical protein AKJ09_10241 [Labilithrix luteola]
MKRRIPQTSGGPTPPTPSEEAHEEGSLGVAFFAGRYETVLARSVDAAAFEFDDADTPYVVGALAFVGRIEEAAATLRAWERRKPTPELRICARFFLAVAHGRAGRHAESERLVRENARLVSGCFDPIARFYVHQGLACHRFFTGRVDVAARQALMALQAAFDARFQYGRLLATDLRGHALVQLGDVHAGLALLDRASTLATTLGLDGNAGAIACATAIYAARFGARPIAASIENLVALAAATSAQDSYSRRSVETELASQLALAGRGDDAWSLLDRLATDPGADGDQRSKVRRMLAFAFVAFLRYGAASARTYAVEARRSLDGLEDFGLEVEVLSIELLAFGESPERLTRLSEIHRRTKIARAAFVRGRWSSESEQDVMAIAPVMVEDKAGAMIHAATSQSRNALETLLREGYLGLVPHAAGLGSPRRLLLVNDDTILVEAQGNVRQLTGLSDGSLRLLRALGGRRKDKETLVREVWKLSTYRPDRHDTLVHTAVSRLRAALGTAGHWVDGEDGAYGIASGVELFDLSSAAMPRTVDDVTADGDAERATATTLDRGPLDELLALLKKSGPISTGEIARTLGISEMTAFRRLKSLLDEGLVVRSGRGKNTRYAPSSMLPENASC